METLTIEFPHYIKDLQLYTVLGKDSLWHLLIKDKEHYKYAYLHIVGNIITVNTPAITEKGLTTRYLPRYTISFRQAIMLDKLNMLGSKIVYHDNYMGL